MDNINKTTKVLVPTFLGNTPSPHPQQDLSIAKLPHTTCFSPWKLIEAALHGDFRQDVFSALIVAGCLPPEQLLPLERRVLTWTQCSGHRLWQLCFPSAWHGTTNSCLLQLHKLQASTPSCKDHNLGQWKSAGATLEDSVKSALVCFSNAALSFSPEQLRHLLVWNLMHCSLGRAGHSEIYFGMSESFSFDDPRLWLLKMLGIHIYKNQVGTTSPDLRKYTLTYRPCQSIHASALWRLAMSFSCPQTCRLFRLSSPFLGASQTWPSCLVAFAAWTPSCSLRSRSWMLQACNEALVETKYCSCAGLCGTFKNPLPQKLSPSFNVFLTLSPTSW